METVQQLNAALDRGEIDSITWARKMAAKGYDISPRKVVEAFRANPNQSAADLINTIGNAATLPTRSHMEQTGKAINSLRENFNKPGGPASAVSGAIDSAGQIARGFGAAFGPEGSPGRTPLAGIVGDVFRGAGKVYSKMSEGNGRTLYGDGKFPGNLDLPARTQSAPAKQEPEKMGMLAKSYTRMTAGKNAKMSASEREAAIKGILNAQAEMADNESYLARENGGRSRVVGAYTNSKGRLVNQPNEFALAKMSDSQLKGLRDSITNDFYKNIVSGNLPAALVKKGATQFKYNNSPSGGRYPYFTARKSTAIDAKKRSQNREWNPETEEFEK